MKDRKEYIHSTVEADTQRIICDSTPFAIREAYRSLYTNVLYLPIEDRCKKIVITSAFPGEGKTSVSVNLAYTIALNSPESKVLIIDADMRSPRVIELLGLNDKKRHGLSEYLAGIDDSPVFIDSVHENLKVLLSGAQNANTPGLISSSRMKSLMQYCNNEFDYIIIDTPPVNIVSDAILLNDYVNGYILVCRADYSDINSFSDAIDNLTKAGAKILGTVLSSYNAKSSKKYGRYGRYGRYGKYGKYGGRYGRYGNKYGIDAYGSIAPLNTPEESSAPQIASNIESTNLTDTESNVIDVQPEGASKENV